MERGSSEAPGALPQSRCLRCSFQADNLSTKLFSVGVCRSMVQAMRQEEVREREEAKKRRQAQQVGTVIASMSCFEGAGN